MPILDQYVEGSIEDEASYWRKSSAKRIFPHQKTKKMRDGEGC
jgi:hypothetical protein